MEQDATLFLDLLCQVLAEHDKTILGVFTKLLRIMNAAGDEQDETIRAEEGHDGYLYLLLCTVAGVSAGVQNTG